MEPYRAQSQDFLVSEENEVQKEIKVSKEQKVILSPWVYLFLKLPAKGFPGNEQTNSLKYLNRSNFGS